MAQFLRPTSDVSAGSWTTAPLWSKVDEAAADGVFITSDGVGNNTDSTVAELALASGLDPNLSSGHVLRLRWRNSDASRSLTANAALYQGSTLIATLTVFVIPGTTTESTLTLTAGEADSISNYGDLRVRLWGRGSAGGSARSLQVDTVELEIPDATTDPPTGTPTLSTTGNDHDSIDLSWTASTNATSYEYRLNGGTAVDFGSNATTGTVGGLSASTQYTVEVRGVNAFGQTAWSNTVTVTTAAAPLELTVLLVGESATDTAKASVGTADQGLWSLFDGTDARSSRSDNVSYRSAADAVNQANDEATYDLIVLSDTSSSTDLASKYTNHAVPVIVADWAITDEMLIAGSGGASTNVVMTLVAAHDTDLGRSINDTITYTNGANGGYSASLPSGATTVWTEASGAAAYYIEEGAALTTGTAPAKRYGLPMYREWGTADLTDDGANLFLAIIEWIAPLAPAVNPLSTTDSGDAGVGETSSLIITEAFDTLDTGDAGVGETVALASSSQVSDVSETGSDEASTVAVAAEATDTADAGVDEATSLVITTFVEATDAADAGVDETTSLVKAVVLAPALDTGDAGADEQATAAVASAVDDTGDAGADETASILVSPLGTDAVTVGVDEATTVAVTLGPLTDTGDAGVDEASQTVTLNAAEDTGDAGVDETASTQQHAFLADDDTGDAGADESAALDVFPRSATSVVYRFPDVDDRSPTDEDPGLAGALIAFGAGATWNGVYSLGYATDPIFVMSQAVGSTSGELAVANDTYFEITLTPDTTLILDELTFNAARGGAATPRGVMVRSSADGYASDLLPATDIPTQRTTWTPFTVDLSSIGEVAGPITFRFYFYAPTSDHSVEFDDIAFTGTAGRVYDAGPAGADEAITVGVAVETADVADAGADETATAAVAFEAADTADADVDETSSLLLTAHVDGVDEAPAGALEEAQAALTTATTDVVDVGSTESVSGASVGTATDDADVGSVETATVHVTSSADDTGDVDVTESTATTALRSTEDTGDASGSETLTTAVSSDLVDAGDASLSVETSAVQSIVQKVHHLTDEFNDTSDWQLFQAQITNGVLRIYTDNADAMWDNVAYYDHTGELTDSFGMVKVVSIPTTPATSNDGIEFQLLIDADNALKMVIDVHSTGEIYLRAVKTDVGVDTAVGIGAYDRAATPYLRMRESGGTIYFEKSADGRNWDNNWGDAGAVTTTVSFSLANLRPQFVAYNNAQVDAGRYGEFDDLNIIPPLITSDSGSAGVGEETVLGITLPVTDDGEAGADETAIIASTGAATDTGDADVTETTALWLRPSSTDTAPAGLDDVVLIDSTTFRSDVLSVEVSEISALGITIPSDDTGPVDASTATSLASTSDLTDTGTSGADEDLSLAIVTFLDAADSADTGVDETALVAITESTTDVVDAGADETTTTLVSWTDSDQGAAGSTEDRVLGVAVQRSDNGPAGASETSASALDSDLVDEAAVGASESATIAVTVAVTDTAEALATESVATTVRMAYSDTATVSVAESTAFYIERFFQLTDTARAGVVEKLRSWVYFEPSSDTGEAAVTETATITSLKLYPGTLVQSVLTVRSGQAISGVVESTSSGQIVVRDGASYTAVIDEEAATDVTVPVRSGQQITTVALEDA